MAATEQYTVRVNVTDGSLEVAGPDRDWVDAKLVELKDVLTAAAEAAEGSVGAAATAKTTRRKKVTKPAAPSPASPAPKPPKRRASGGSRPQLSDELQRQLTADVRARLKTYVAARSKAWSASKSAQAAIVATFLNDELGMAGVDPHDLYTVYTVMGERTPGNIRSQLTNARQRDRYFGGISNGKWTLSHAGENFARHDSLDEDETPAA